MSLPNGSVNAVPKPFEGIWEGESKIVIGIDIGTTQSGVAFAFLQQGGKQEVHRVTHWPGQEAANMQSKFPTLVWYDRNGKAVSFGAEALSHQAEEDAEDQGWQLAKHFKLHLHPGDMKAKHKLKLDGLPAGVPLRRIYSDFMRYLLGHTRSFFQERVVDGPVIWENYHSQMEVIIAHPNGWGIREQTFLRDAAVDAGLASAAFSYKVRFVTEAEASVHFCINRTNLGSCLQVGTKFAVCDAGGSTVDTTVYSVVAVRPMLKLEEARASACVQAGAIYVDAAAREYFKRVLTDESKKDAPKKDGAVNAEDVEEYTTRGVKDFEMVAKRTFRDTAEEKAIEIAGTRFNNPSIRTRRGRMTLPGPVIKSFFDICVNEITTSVDQQIKGAEVSYMLLVGGFGDSPFLRQAFKNRYEPQGCQVTLTNDSTSKAVAEGAVIWNAISSVVGRAPRLSFGIEVAVPNDPTSVEFRGRQVYMCPSGEERVNGVWAQIVAKDIVIDADAVNRRTFSSPSSSPYPDLDDFEVTLLSFSQPGQPKWARTKKGGYQHGFQKSCTITANLANLSGALRPAIGLRGKIYWILDFDICIRFGGTELEAYLEWEEDGTTRKGKVTVVPDNPI
ncbi:hypothetical protein FRC06_010028 [Ceratobasidium sp. 370]|nr:hypothetical protein FRC06_010028 [Ceratobasidium sp. 370]